MKNLLVSPLFLLLLPFLTQAQQHQHHPLESPFYNCAADEMLRSRPELWLKQQQLEEQILAQKGNTLSAKSAPLPYVLPLVVHIIHQNGAENIADDQVFAAVEHLNQAFAHEGYYAQLGNGANTQIQFCLAKRTPDGQLTNGITRTNSALTQMVMETDDQAVKDLNRWDTKKYVNVWVVKSVTSQAMGPGVAGYAYLASAHGEPFDGLVCEAPYFGVDAAQDVVFIHELGHYLNLYHTFEGGCPNANCQNSGDRVCDTPPDKATHTFCEYNSCNTDANDPSPNNPFTSDVNDATENFMDYSPFECYRSFTAGQGERMRLAIENYRSSLLESTTCLDPCSTPITAAFSSSATDVVTGETVVFSNQSIGAIHFEWYVNGLLVTDSTNFSYQFNNTGNFLIRLKAYNNDPNCVETAELNLQVKCLANASFIAGSTEITRGETLTFTNTSTGATEYVWKINGVDVGTTTDLNFTFNNVGFYTILLQAGNGTCNSDFSTALLVYSDGPCRDSVTATHLHFDAPPSAGFYRNPRFLPDGGLYAWTTNFVARFDAQRNSLWQVKVNAPVNGLEDICVLDDASTLYSVDGHKVVKINADGTLAWSKSVAIPGGSYEFFSINLGDGALFYANENNSVSGNNLYLIKFLSNGAVAWSRRYQFNEGVTFPGDFAHDYFIADDKGFWLAGYTDSYYPPFLHNGGVVLRFDLNGNLLFSKRYRLDNSENVAFFTLSVNKNSEFVVSGVTDYNPDTDYFNYLTLKGDANGNVVWSKKVSQANNYQYYFLHKMRTKPAGGYLQMLRPDLSEGNWASWSESGQLEFVESFNSPGFLEDIIEKDGQMTGVVKPAWNANNFYLYNLTAEGKPAGCAGFTLSTLPTVDVNGIVTDFPFTVKDTSFGITSYPVTVGAPPSPLHQTTVCLAPPNCIEFCDNGRDDDEDGYVDCFDSDCACFELDTACAITIEPSNTPFSAKIEWESPQDVVNYNSTPFVGNLNPLTDSIPEILVLGAAQTNDEIIIYRGDGSNMANPVVFKYPGIKYLVDTPPVIADINADGTPELLLAMETGKIAVFTNYQENQSPPFTLWFESSPAVTGFLSAMGVADFDHDGIPEIYIGNEIYSFDFTNPNAPGLSRKLKGTAHSGARYPLNPGFLDASAAADLLSKADCNGDPDCDGLELAAGAYIYSVDLDLTDGDGMQIKIQRNLNTLAPGQTFHDGFTQIADINLDGLPDVIVNSPTSITKGIYAWDKNGLITIFPYSPSNIQFSLGKITISNVFDDRTLGFAQDFPEIIGKLDNPLRIVAYNLNAQSMNAAQPFWWSAPSDDVSHNCFVSAFDFNRDGYDELVAKGDTFLRVYYGGAAPFPPGVNPNNRIWFQIANQSGTVFDGAIVADVDADNEAEILYAWNTAGISNKDGKLRVLESASLPWPSARPIWNQFNYFGVAINDDLTVPRTQQKHWLEMGGIGSGKRPFNTHLAQVASLNPLNNNKIKVPDASVVLDSTHCKTDSFELFLTICNLGSKALPAGTPIAFYNGNPTATSAPLLFPPVLLPETLEKGDCKNIKWRIPATYNATIFIVVNDDGTLPRPFSLSTNFPSTDQAECGYENNMASFSIQNQTIRLELGPDISLCKNSVVELSATPGFQKYRWQDGSTHPNLTAYSPGKYWVDAFDACGFKQSDTINIVLNTLASPGLPEGLTACTGETIHLSASGFSKYIWSPADSLNCGDCAEVTLLTTQPITIYLTAAEGDCIVTDSTRITINPAPTLDLEFQNGDCGTPARITAIVPGVDSLDLAFLWSNGLSENAIHPVQSGSYTVTVSNSSGCTAVDSATVLIYSNLGMGLETTQISCGSGSGAITATVAGGSGQYGFVWSTGATTDTIAVTLPGTYAVTVTDLLNAGCVVVDSIEVKIRGGLLLNTTAMAVSCNNGEDGATSAMPIDGTPPYTWLWQSGQTDALLLGLSVGTYTVTVSDAIGCTGSAAILVTEPDPLIASIQTPDSLLCPDETTSVTIIAEGGTPPYDFLWSTGQTDDLLTGIHAGSYSVTVTDAQNCAVTTVREIDSDPLVSITVDTIIQASGPVVADGSVLISISGGLPPLAFLWSNGETTQNLQAVLPGNYTLTVTDAGGCMQIFSTSVGFSLASGQPASLGWEASLLPNPAQESAAAQLIIQSSVAQVIDIQLFDATGRFLWKDRFELTTDLFVKKITAPAVAGVHFLVLKNGQEVMCLKWVVLD